MPLTVSKRTPNSNKRFKRIPASTQAASHQQGALKDATHSLQAYSKQQQAKASSSQKPPAGSVKSYQSNSSSVLQTPKKQLSTQPPQSCIYLGKPSTRLQQRIGFPFEFLRQTTVRIVYPETIQTFPLHVCLLSLWKTLLPTTV